MEVNTYAITIFTLFSMSYVDFFLLLLVYSTYTVMWSITLNEFDIPDLEQ